MSHPMTYSADHLPPRVIRACGFIHSEQKSRPLQGGILFSSQTGLHSLMHPNLPPSTTPLDQPFSSETTLTFQRSRDRLSIVCPVMFAGAPFIGEGVIHNLSPTGCRVECDRMVLQGSYMTLRLLLPDGIRSLIVELAAVRWVRSRYFGIEFLRLHAPDQARLEQFLTRRHR